MFGNAIVTALVLASSSPHRRVLLERLGLPFVVDAPGVDESRLPGESPEDLVGRLAASKAQAVAARWPDAVVIGSDQVAAISGEPTRPILGKPENRQAALEQLRMLSGREVHFLTGLCVIDPEGGRQLATDTTLVRFRHLSDPEIAVYVDREEPFGCAASFRSERLGITLVEAIRGTDPNALVGLPLIRLCGMLRRVGCNPLR